MTQEEKSLLYADLCARLPYNVMIRYSAANGIYRKTKLTATCLDYIKHMGGSGWIDCKPYLRPLSSMTEEESEDIKTLMPYYADLYLKGDRLEICIDIDSEADPIIWMDTPINVIGWFNARHFDYRGLISNGLALEAKAGMYN